MDAYEDSVKAKEEAVDAVDVLEGLIFFVALDEAAAVVEGITGDEIEVRSMASAMAWISSREVLEREIDADDLYGGGVGSMVEGGVKCISTAR